MFAQDGRQRSVRVCHLHMGGPDGDALQFVSLLSPRFAPRLRQMGVTVANSPADADVLVVTGLLTLRNLDWVLTELARLPSPAALVAAGDCAINGGAWAKHEMPGLAPYPLGHYADVQIAVPGNPPTPQALIAAIAAAGESLALPGERLEVWQDD